MAYARNYRCAFSSRPWAQPDTVPQLSDANEMTDPNTVAAWVEHAIGERYSASREIHPN